MENLPYAQLAGTLENMLLKIKTASVPENFSQDFVSTKLSMKGGTARSIIPFIKKMGLVTPDGSPTPRYTAFRNMDKAGAAIADAMREVYATLFEMNEYVYELDNEKLKGLIVEATGAKADSNTVAKTLATFVVLNKMADFDAGSSVDTVEADEFQTETKNLSQIPIQENASSSSSSKEGINLSYTINLNLPATKDIEVFNAIFKSLKQHLLQD
ncbi:MAG: hypothetical protein ACJA2R_000794 [Saprospiraceae bacterium]|jgi:hypothetical protein